jgi:hypothetical protein
MLLHQGLKLGLKRWTRHSLPSFAAVILRAVLSYCYSRQPGKNHTTIDSPVGHPFPRNDASIVKDSPGFSSRFLIRFS